MSGSGSAVVRDDDRARPREPVPNCLVYPRSSPTASATTRRPWARGLAGCLLGAGTLGLVHHKNSRRLSWEDGMRFFGFWRFSDERCLRVGWTLYYILAPLVRLYDALLFMEDVIMKRPRLEAFAQSRASSQTIGDMAGSHAYLGLCSGLTMSIMGKGSQHGLE